MNSLKCIFLQVRRFLFIPNVCYGIIVFGAIFSSCVRHNAQADILRERAISVAIFELEKRNWLPPQYEQFETKEEDHWSIVFVPLEFDNTGDRICTSGNNPVIVLIDFYGNILAIHGRRAANFEELIKWENNLRNLTRE